MVSADQKNELINEFPDLADPDMTLQKEVYAHFGLLFFKFALIEHSLINIHTLNRVVQQFRSKRIRTEQDWEAAFDRAFSEAKKKTLRELSRKVCKIPEFRRFAAELDELNNYRNHFAHHFFREEVGLYSDDDGCWEILWAMKELREKIIALDTKLEQAFEKMHARVGVPVPSDELMRHGEAKIQQEAQERLAAGQIFPWQKG